jgi:AraC-like DNA-binding protein
MAAHSKVVNFDNLRSDFEPYGFTCVLWAPTMMPRPDRHNEIEINFLRSGTVTYLIGGRRVTVEARRLVLFWAALPHQILNWDTTKPYYVATLPLAWFLGCGFPEHFAHPILAGEILTDPAPTSGDEAKFRQWVDDVRSRKQFRERVAQAEIQARLLRLSATLPARKAPLAKKHQESTPDPSLSRADQIACYIAQHYAEPITADQIAKAVGLHPNYAMGLFRKAFGTTMVDFLVQHRLSHAQRLLVTSEKSVIEIAAAAGFGSLSRFNEAFKDACGCAPRDYRKAHRAPL